MTCANCGDPKSMHKGGCRLCGYCSRYIKPTPMNTANTMIEIIRTGGRIEAYRKSTRKHK